MGDSIKSLAEVKVDNIHGSPKQNNVLELFCQQPSLNTREERLQFYHVYVSNAIVASHGQ